MGPKVAVFGVPHKVFLMELEVPCWLVVLVMARTLSSVFLWGKRENGNHLSSVKLSTERQVWLLVLSHQCLVVSALIRCQWV